MAFFVETMSMMASATKLFVFAAHLISFFFPVLQGIFFAHHVAATIIWGHFMLSRSLHFVLLHFVQPWSLH